MLVAVGMYLPFDTTSGIFIGGVMKWAADRVAEKLSAEKKLAFEEKGTLLASGLIAGEAIVGIMLAVVFLAGIPALARFGFYPVWGGGMSLRGFVGIGCVLSRIAS